MKSTYATPVLPPQVRYVVDFYNATPAPGQIIGMHLDVRPALDSPGVRKRVRLSVAVAPCVAVRRPEPRWARATVCCSCVRRRRCTTGCACRCDGWPVGGGGKARSSRRARRWPGVQQGCPPALGGSNSSRRQ